MSWASYILGVLTLPVMTVLVFLLLVLFDRIYVGQAACSRCLSAGIRSRETYIEDPQFRVTYFLRSQWHLQITTRRPSHRLAWQAWFKTLALRSNLRDRMVMQQDRFGI